ncbi:MAG: hypothetical protein IKV55_04310, partial [Oscillospiraceae bacterium]|nr:hypothetical protein [Oscillospiraceae bacterium]
MEFVIEKVFERDIDLLILEEFACEPTFQELFLRQAGITGEVQLLAAEHSRTDTDLGESDIFFKVSAQNKTIGIFVEDKINAIAMQQQAGRYRQRAQRMKENKEIDDFCTFITAPEKYIANNSEAAKYDYSVSYETLCAYFAAKQDVRSKYKLALLQ